MDPTPENARALRVATICCVLLALISTAAGVFAIARAALVNSTKAFDHTALFIGAAIWLPLLLYLIAHELLRRKLSWAVTMVLAVAGIQVLAGLGLIAKNVRHFQEWKLAILVTTSAVVALAAVGYFLWQAFARLRADSATPEPIAS